MKKEIIDDRPFSVRERDWDDRVSHTTTIENLNRLEIPKDIQIYWDKENKKIWGKYKKPIWKFW